ncbi:MAG: hypothetical protein ACP5NS_04595 [Candidatus Pacearchaeota archaeon]
MMMENKMNKRAQEEIVGFVLIVVLVVIVAVIFLGIRLRNPEVVQKDSEIVYQFIESAMEQTTSCKKTQTGNFIAVDDLMRECHASNSICVTGEPSCEVLDNTIRNMLNATWVVGPEYPYKGYSARAVYSLNSSDQSQQEEVLNITQGNCQDSFVGSSYIIPEFPGTITFTVKICT